MSDKFNLAKINLDNAKYSYNQLLSYTKEYQKMCNQYEIELDTLRNKLNNTSVNNSYEMKKKEEKIKLLENNLIQQKTMYRNLISSIKEKKPFIKRIKFILTGKLI